MSRTIKGTVTEGYDCKIVGSFCTKWMRLCETVTGVRSARSLARTGPTVLANKTYNFAFDISNYMFVEP
jgi:hypothetical protein